MKETNLAHSVAATLRSCCLVGATLLTLRARAELETDFVIATDSGATNAFEGSVNI